MKYLGYELDFAYDKASDSYTGVPLDKEMFGTIEVTGSDPKEVFDAWVKVIDEKLVKEDVDPTDRFRELNKY